MIKLLKIEWLKFKGNRFFWIGFGLYLIAMVLLMSFAGSFELIKSKPEDGQSLIKITNLKDAGLYKLPFIWQNLLYAAIWFKFIPAFLFIFFIGNEFTYRTFRQNVIDGLSVPQFYFSKVISAFVFAFISFIVMGITIITLGFIHNPEITFSDFLVNSDYLIAYFIEVFFLMIFILFLVILTKKSTVSIIVFLIYYFMLELIFMGLLNAYTANDLGYYLPTQPSRELITEPITRLFSMDFILGTNPPETLNYKFVWFTLFYTLVFGLGGFWILKKRDI